MIFFRENCYFLVVHLLLEAIMQFMSERIIIHLQYKLDKVLLNLNNLFYVLKLLALN